MPKMWFSKNGRRPHSQSGSAIHLTQGEVVSLFSGSSLMLVGSQPPSINSDTPSDTLLNVILELEADESTFGPMPVTGYYLAVGARPEDIQRQLQVLGKQSPR